MCLYPVVFVAAFFLIAEQYVMMYDYKALSYSKSFKCVIRSRRRFSISCHEHLKYNVNLCHIRRK